MDKTDAMAADPTQVPLRYRFATKAVLSRLRRWRPGRLTLRLPDRTIVECGDPAAAPHVTVTVKAWRFFWRVLTGADIGVGESYMAGEWESSDLVEVCRLFLRDQSTLDHRSVWTVPKRLWHTWLWRSQANSLTGSRRNIQYHYDLSNELYRLFLDDSMMYSCAVFDRDDASLEEAQAQKLDAICRCLELRPGMRVLEIGSGWGAFAIHAACRYGCHVTGLTLSDEQLALGRERVAAAGMASLVDIQLCDYRTVSGCFDRIVSIEMFEAVGYEYYGAYFGACARLLKPGGRMFLQTISVPDQRFETYRRDFDWIKKYIFPGGLLASLSVIAETLKQQTDLRIDWMQDIGVHYARTLGCWRDRFMRRVADVRRLGFDDRFIRMWEFYLASCEAAFSIRYIGDLQLVLAKPTDDTVSA